MIQIKIIVARESIATKWCLTIKTGFLFDGWVYIASIGLISDSWV